ncbi:MAG: hypothetical protein Q9170_007729, partial [Blastenia crenularia]
QQHEGGNESAIDLSASPADASSSSVWFKETQTNNTRNQRSALASHLIFFNLPSARERNQAFIDSVFEILTGDRSSATSQRTIANVQKAQKAHKTAIENVYTLAVFPVLIGISRTVPDLEMLEYIQPIIRSFTGDHLHCERLYYFLKNLLKGPTTKKDFGFTNPRLDLGFNIKNKTTDLNPPKVLASTRNLIRAAGCLNYYFSLSEVKSPDDPFAHS